MKKYLFVISLMFYVVAIQLLASPSIATGKDNDWMKKLPNTIRPYLVKNYPGYRIKSAISDPMCDGSPAIDVSIRKKGKPSYSLIFKPDGSFVQKEQDVPLLMAPSEIQKTIKTQYSEYHVGNQVEKLTLADNSVQYLVDIIKGKQAKEVTLNMNGIVVCEH